MPPKCRDRACSVSIFGGCLRLIFRSKIGWVIIHESQGECFYEMGACSNFLVKVVDTFLEM